MKQKLFMYFFIFDLVMLFAEPGSFSASNEASSAFPLCLMFTQHQEYSAALRDSCAATQRHGKKLTSLL